MSVPSTFLMNLRKNFLIEQIDLPFDKILNPKVDSKTKSFYFWLGRENEEIETDLVSKKDFEERIKNGR